MPVGKLVTPVRTQSQEAFDDTATYLFGIGLNAFADEVNATEATILGVAELVEEANAAATAAVSMVDVTKWVAGDYIEGDVRWSPTNGQTYRAKDAHTSATDPASDATHWWPVSPTSFGGAVISRAMFRDVGYVYVDKGDSGTATQTIDVAAGTHQRIRATGNFTIAFFNWPATGNTGEVLLELAHDGTARSITFPTGCRFVKYDGSVTTTFSETLINLQSADGAIDWLYFWTRDAGTTLYCKVIR